MGAGFQDSRSLRIKLSSGTNLFHRLQDFGVFRLEAPIHRHVFSRVFTEEDQGVTDVVGLIDCQS